MPPKGKPQGRSLRPTHFVCLPLVTEGSIPQLIKSLAYFRSVTTSIEDGAAPQQGACSRLTTESTAGNSSNDFATQEGVEKANLAQSESPDDRTSDKNLRIIPPAAHRPPGTFHLTLGVMDLSKMEDVEMALQLLQDIDYVELLKEAEKQPVGGKRNAKDDSRTTEEGDEADAGRTENISTLTEKFKTAAAESVLKTPLESLTRAISPPPASTSQSASQTPSNAKPHTTSSVPVSRSNPLTVSLHSLGTFPRPSSSRVFFAHPHDPTNRLQRFAELVQQRFKEASLIAETRPLVLHATVANMIYAKSKGRGGRGYRGKGRRENDGSIDAREVLDIFNEREVEFVWAEEIPIDRVRICKMGAEKSDIEGWGLEYKPVAEKVFVDAPVS